MDVKASRLFEPEYHRGQCSETTSVGLLSDGCSDTHWIGYTILWQMQEIRPDAIEMVGGSIYRNGSLVLMENGLKNGKRRVGKNCLKQQTQNAMNATLSQNGLGENRFHEVPPFKHN